MSTQQIESVRDYIMVVWHEIDHVRDNMDMRDTPDPVLKESPQRVSFIRFMYGVMMPESLFLGMSKDEVQEIRHTVLSILTNRQVDSLNALTLSEAIAIKSVYSAFDRAQKAVEAIVSLARLPGGSAYCRQAPA